MQSGTRSVRVVRRDLILLKSDKGFTDEEIAEHGNRGRKKMKSHYPTSSGSRMDVIHAALIAWEILFVLPWRSAFRESSRVDSSQSAFWLVG